MERCEAAKDDTVARSRMRDDEIEMEIADAVGDPFLARDLHRSLRRGLRVASASFAEHETELGLFAAAVASVERHIESDPKGELFRRFVCYGPTLDSEPQDAPSPLNYAGGAT